MLAYLATNTETFDGLEDCLVVVERALDRAGWHSSYSRQLTAGSLCFRSEHITFGQLTGNFLYLDIHNRRSDIAALETTGRLAAYAKEGDHFEPSGIRSPLKATGRPGYSHTIFPNSYETFDLLCFGKQVLPGPQSSTRAVEAVHSIYLNTSLDVSPLPSLPISDGTWRLKFEFFAIDFPLLTVLIRLTISGTRRPVATLIAC
jgi:hypothetical protein